MYVDDYGNIENADEITCPHCNEKFYDSYQYIDGDNESWEMQCEECGKKFMVTWDQYNQSNGFKCSKICKKHSFVFQERKYERKVFDWNKYWISKYANVYICKKCGEYKFVDLKDDGSEYSKSEIAAWEQKKNQKEELERNPHLVQTKEKKVVTIRFVDTKLIIGTEKPEGNQQLFKKINNKLKSIGFSVEIEDIYLNELKSLKKYNRYLKRDWLECKAEFHQNDVEYEFYQNIYTADRKKGDGYYCFDKYKIMDDKQKVVMRSIFLFLKKYLEKTCIVKTGKKEDFDWHGYVEIKDEDNLPGRKIMDLVGKDFEDRSCENKDKNGKLLKAGDFKLCYDCCGRLIQGHIYNRCGSNKFLVHNDKTYSIVSPRSTFDFIPGLNLPKKLSDKRESRLRSLLNECIKSENFEKCIIIRDLLNKEFGGDK